MRAIALQSAVGGMALSALGMLAAAFGLLPAIDGAVAQELIDRWPASMLSAWPSPLPNCAICKSGL